MFENIQGKIEAIRREPEHVRVKYLAGSLALSMLVVVVLWFFSIHEGMRGISKEAPKLKETIGTQGEKSIKDLSVPVGQGEKRGESEEAEEYFQSEIGRSR